MPVFSIRTENDLGIGDTEGVHQMIDWCHKHGIGILQVLPINETSDDNSPYNAISSMALDPTTVAISPEHIPDLSSREFKEIAGPELLKELRAGPVKYTKVKELKRSLLRAAFDTFLAKHWNKKTERSDAFRAFLAENGDWISDYAMFRVLMEDYHNWPTWDEWPQDRQNPKRPGHGSSRCRPNSGMSTPSGSCFARTCNGLPTISGRKSRNMARGRRST